MSELALVSIVIAAYKSDWFVQALESALAQDYPHCEIIIGDDCPLDNIERLLAPYLQQPRFPITYIRSGLSNTRQNYQQLVIQSQGELIKFLDDDDLLVADCISRMVSALRAVPEAAMVSARRQMIDPQGIVQDATLESASPVSGDSLIHGADVIRLQSEALVNFAGGLSSVMLRRQPLLALIAEDGGLFSLQGREMTLYYDLALYLKLLQNGHLLWLDESLSSYRLSRQQQSRLVRENDPLALELAQHLSAVINTPEWQGAAVAMPGYARVAPLAAPGQFNLQPLRNQLNSSFNTSNFAAWLAVREITPAQQQQIAAHRGAGAASVRLLVVVDASQTSEQQRDLTLASVRAGSFQGLSIDSWVIEHDGDNSAARDINRLNQLLLTAEYDWVVLVKAGSQLLAAGLGALSTTLPQAQQLLAIYCDEIHNVNGYPLGPVFRPDFNLDLLLSAPALMAHHWLFRRELIVAAAGFSEAYPAAAELELILRLIDSQGNGDIGHLGEPLLIADRPQAVEQDEQAALRQHLTNRGFSDAQIFRDERQNYRIIYQHAATPLVSVIVPVADDLQAAARCVDSLLSNTRYSGYELLLVLENNPGAERSAWFNHYLQREPTRIKVCHADGDYHFGARANVGALQAKGDYLVFLHSQLQLHDDTWLANLLNQALRAEVGGVGGLQLTPEGTVEHAGYLLGVKGLFGEAFKGMEPQQSVHMDRLQVEQSYSAVSADFMAMRKSLFFEANGFDMSLQGSEGVDLCLRLRELGFITVWTPYACAIRHPRSSVSDAAQPLCDREHDEPLLYQRWMPLLGRDPAYNANLSLNNTRYDIASDAARTWRPVSWRPLPVILAGNADSNGCGHYRIIQPMEAMQRESVIEGYRMNSLLEVPLVMDYQPDSMVIQRQYYDDFHRWMARIKRTSTVFKVFELDDYLPNLPMKSMHRDNFKQDVVRLLRKSLGMMDRFVVSTEPLAEAFAAMHGEIVVMKNRLPVNWWDGLTSLRNQGKKPRVGWAGGASHTGDLEMIADVVKAFAGEVEWVFMGMCPAKLRPYISEFHPGTDIHLYPQKLASLNLDLALAPVEDNLFNACKSNLRLLEYGACGWPVICSDIVCYRGDLPATRVRNRFKDWCDAIRMHLDDPTASEQMGRALHDAVKRDWMLTGDNLVQWAKCWLPGEVRA